MVNELERKEILTSMITLYGASIFLQENSFESFWILTSVFILLVNANFFCFWIYAFLKSLGTNLLTKLPLKEKIIHFMENYLWFKDKGNVEKDFTNEETFHNKIQILKKKKVKKQKLNALEKTD